MTWPLKFVDFFYEIMEDDAETRRRQTKGETPPSRVNQITHIRTHISDPVQINIYRQCTRGYIYLYI